MCERERKYKTRSISSFFFNPENLYKYNFFVIVRACETRETNISSHANNLLMQETALKIYDVAKLNALNNFK